MQFVIFIQTLVRCIYFLRT